MVERGRRRPPVGYVWVDISPTTRVLLPEDTNYLENYAPNIQYTIEEHTENEYRGREDEPLALPYSVLLRRLVSRNCDLPLIMPANNSIVVTFDDDRTYRCGPSGVAPPQSRFMAVGFVEGGASSGLNMYGFTWNGRHLYSFCLDHTKNMPSGPYANISMETAMSRFTRQVQLAVSFAIAQAPITITDDEGAQELMEMLGAPCASEVNGYDAWGMVQATIWCLLGQGDPGTVYFENCPEGAASASKLQCLYDAMNVLYSMAFDYANGNLDCGEGGGGPGSGGGGVSTANFCCRANTCCGCSDTSCETCGGEEGQGCSPGRACCGCQLGKLFVCYTGGRVTDQSDTYLVFVGCVNDMREHCGRVLLGPFKLDSTNSGAPDITITPCEGCPSVDITLTDYCGRRLEGGPSIGEEFYITFQPPCIRYCFDLRAGMWTTASAVYYFRRPGANYLQPIGVPFEEERYREASVHICIDLTPLPPSPPPPSPPPPPPIEILIKNDNNNNNDNNLNGSDNNDNNSSLLSNLLDQAAGSVLAGGGNAMPGGNVSGAWGILAPAGGALAGIGGYGMMPGIFSPGAMPGMPGIPFGFSPCGPCAPCKPFCAPPPSPCPPSPPPWPPCAPCPPPSFFCPPSTPPPPAPMPMPPPAYAPPPPQAVTDPHLLLPQASSAPRPDLADFEFDDDFFRDWYQI